MIVHHGGFEPRAGNEFLSALFYKSGCIYYLFLDKEHTTN